jgi:hypothetical protein
MTVTNTWLIEQMDCYPTAEGQTDVVFTIHWRLNAADGTYAATAYGTVGVTYVAGSPYTPFAQLTQAQVVGWVQESLGAEQVTKIEASLATNIANQINPPVVSPPLPWSA